MIRARVTASAFCEAASNFHGGDCCGPKGGPRDEIFYHMLAGQIKSLLTSFDLCVTIFQS